MTLLYALGIWAAGALGAELRDAKARLLEAHQRIYDGVSPTMIQERIFSLRAILNHYLAISLHVEIHLSKLSWSEHSEAIKVDKRVTRDFIRREISKLQVLAASDFGVKGLKDPSPPVLNAP